MLRFLRSGGKHTKTIWWVLIIVTVVTFLGGFVFLLGAGLDRSFSARASGAIATVNGASITRDEFNSALNDQRAAYQQRYSQEPGERDIKMLEVQAWRSLVLQRVLSEQAKSLGLKAHDREIVLALQTSPPAQLVNMPQFQTNGKFDATKYQQAMRDPANNWSGFEDAVRRQLPVRKLQERLISSIKLSEPELRESFRDRFERCVATVLMIGPNTEGAAPTPTDADLQRVYDKYKSRFASGQQTDLEALVVPKHFGDTEVRAARELAQSLVDRARKGESFTALARDYSEGPAADQGGIVDRVFDPTEFGAEMAPKVATMDTGGVTDPVQDGGRFLFFKVLARPANPQTGRPGVRVAQIIVKVKPDTDQLRKQYEDLQKLRTQATHDGLGKAASARGLTTTRTGYFDFNGAPPALYGVPEATDWGLGAKLKDVSPVFEGIDDFAIVQVAAVKPAGIPPKSDVTEQLRQVATIDAQVERAKPRADQVAQALASGRTLEQAAAAAGLTTVKLDAITRSQPEPSIAGAPELVGALFAAQPGQVVGPVRGINGWYFGRLEQHAAADTALFEQVKAQVSNEMLSQRQQSFMNQYMAKLRQEAKVKDLRGLEGGGADLDF
jgi:peptidyl-prolyl cis-trans isomerase D